MNQIHRYKIVHTRSRLTVSESGESPWSARQQLSATAGDPFFGVPNLRLGAEMPSAERTERDNSEAEVQPSGQAHASGG